ncbi:triple tyrosine motif-containing protein [Lutibacter sp.]|uniref:triple tyrosine motif-containing protein n=1 Tax=Lutibacter sp. TaxID=1925666 RepID=UPI0025BE674D|nr:triple tyrosine motif-containing protein [Lutibacter sp.]MCF6180626.1 LuxR C-terminal-related transcriptional regulator [Lutibacter sp.]
MNFKKSILFYLLFLAAIKLSAQELPPIQNYTPEDYGAENQNWSISQSSEKYIYVANNSGLLEYNGAEWNLYNSPNSTIIRSVKVIGNKIYTGCYMEFGFWQRNKFGNLYYTSLINKLKTPLIEGEQFWNIIEYDNWILFQTHNRIYFYDTVNDEFNVINSNNAILKVFNINDIIYYYVESEGVYKIVKGKNQLIYDEPIFKKDRVINMFSIHGGLLIQTRNSGFYVFKNDKISIWNIAASNFLKKVNVFNSIQLNDKSFVLGTISNGVVFLSKSGEIEYQINQKNGLINNTALSIFEDENENIWVGLDNGISTINIKSAVRIFKDNIGNIGTIYDSKIFNSYLYIGTNQGVFYKKWNTKNSSFKFIEGTAGQVWSLFIFDNKLFCGHDYGTFIIKKNKAQLIANIHGTWGFRPVPNNNQELLQGNYKGLYVLSKESGSWKLKNKIKGFDSSARYFNFLSDSEICVSHEYTTGIFTLEVNRKLTEVNKINKDSLLPVGKSSSLSKYKHQLLYAVENGIFKYNVNKKHFLKDTILSPLILDGGFLSGKIVVDETGKLWGFSKEYISYVSFNNITNKLKINNLSIPASLRKGIIGYENISYLEKNKYLLGTTNGYLIIDISKINTSGKNTIYLNSIVIKSRDKVVQKLNVLQNIKTTELKVNQNSIFFQYSVPVYDKYQIIKYQYKLNGYYNDWSNWDSQTNVSFENLSFGKYNFEVRAKIGNKLSQNISNFQFIINRPWYLTKLAIIIYVFILFAIALLIHKAYKKHYKKQIEHQEKENERLKVRFNNEKLNQEIDSKNKELAILTMSLIKKNEVLNNIKKEMNSKNLELKDNSVIKLIDQDLKNSNDWKFFEEAFNSADKNFFEKIKKSHPNLTPNDLRFCAFLRLNLTSKEIAPLLNISVRSVEIKRYRLRKKMNLSHKDSLISHILEI